MGVLFLFNSIVRIAGLFSLTLGHVSLQYNKLTNQNNLTIMEKTYVFDTADKGGFDSTALIASLMGNRGVDPNLMALIQNASKNQDAWDRIWERFFK